MSSTGSPFPNPSHTESTDVNVHGTALLASLIEFIRPTRRTPHSNITVLCTSTQGQELLKTLATFVSLVVKSEEYNANDEAEDASRTRIEEQATEAQSPNEILLPTDSIMHEEKSFLFSNMVAVHNAIMSKALPGEVIEAVNNHVFNKMPIRMISFDSMGTNCTLVERSEMASIILGHMQEANLSEYELREISRNPYYLLSTPFCKYAILSHTWLRTSPGDVLFHDWAKRTFPQNARGNTKIANFCAVAAREHSVLLGWMDTICINKNSSAELDESIRSMYAWYKGAHVCITYLADTLDFEQIPADTWFTRGWTLQELLANRNIYFYNRDWTQLLPGDFTAHLHDPEFASSIFDESLLAMPVEMQYQVFKATSITQKELVRFYIIIPICRVMELAAKRKVTRAEDQIYSLMGLLEVSIPIAYGEGSKNALQRIIQQIMISRKEFLDLFNHTNEESIFPATINQFLDHARTVQNRISPQDPLILSHLGVHATFLTIPLFKEEVYKHNFPINISMECISWSLDYINPNQSYIALDNSRGAAKWISSLDIPVYHRITNTTVESAPPFIFLAIFSSQVNQEHGDILISSGDNLGVLVLPDLFDPGAGDGIVTKRLIDIKPRNPSSYGNGIYRQRLGPVRINLPYSGPNVSENGVLTLTAAEAKHLGFKVLSAYFQ